MKVPPTVRELLVILSHDSDITMNFEADILEPADALMLEQEASRIPPELRQAFVIGEELAQESIARTYRAHLLSHFISISAIVYGDDHVQARMAKGFPVLYDAYLEAYRSRRTV